MIDRMAEMVYFYPDGHGAHFEPGHPERPDRVEAILTTLEDSGMWDVYQKIPAVEIQADLLYSVHSPAYLSVLEMTCKRAGHLDMDTFTTPASWSLALQAAGGAAAIASAVWERKSACGFALTRPPGHHAMRGQGMGFCLVNNIAIAAEYLIQNHWAQRLAIIDLDLHHGNGTQDIFWTRNDVLYISCHQSPFYPGSGRVEDIGSGQGEGRTANFPLPAGSGDDAFLAIMDELVIPLLDKNLPQMLLVSYGFDPHWLDPLGQLLLTADGYAKLIKKLSIWAGTHCDGRIALFLEGGYDLNAGKVCSLAVLSAMLEREWSDPYPCPYKESTAWHYMLKVAHSIWGI